jgi:molybdate transport system ATP-binding protein
VRDEFRLPIVYVTHALGELLYLADDVVLIEAGRVAQQGPLADLAGRVGATSLAARPDAGTLLDVIIERVDAHSVRADWYGTALQVHAFPCRVGQRARLYVQAQDVIVASERPRSISVRNVLEARVRQLARSEQGAVQVELDVGGRTLLAAVTEAAAAELELSAGRVVYALIKSVVIEAPAGLARLHES